MYELKHTDQACAVARETGWDIDTDAREREWTAIGIGPVGIHRDSDALARSNMAVILADLQERFGERVDVARFGHWGVGWIEEIIHDAGHAETVAAVADWRERLEDYPVADEEHWSALELDELTEWCSHLYWSEIGGREVIPNPFLSADALAAEIAGMIGETFGANRVEDAPGEPEIGAAALDAGLYVLDAEPIEAELQAASDELERLRAIVADVDRGIADFGELRDACRTPEYVA
jgi:hypothetical protein